MTTLLRDKSPSSPYQVELWILSGIATALIWAWLLRYSHYGFDFTDESYYLAWMSHPEYFRYSGSQFGFVYHPLYQLLGGKIALLRQVNMGLTFGLAWCLCYVYQTTFLGLKSLKVTQQCVLSAAFATSALVFMNTWLPTPSYNSLNLQALIIAAIGLITLDKTASFKSILGWIALGVGGWLAFMAKPTTALILGMMSIVYLLITQQFILRRVAIAIIAAIALLMLSAVLIDGSVAGFYKRLEGGLSIYRLLEGGHTTQSLLNLNTFRLKHTPRTAIVVLTLLFFVTGVLSQVSARWGRSLSFALSVVISAMIIGIIWGFIPQTVGCGRFQGLLLWAIPLATLLIVATSYRNRLSALTRSQWAIVGVFLVLPHAYAVGTNINYWIVSCSAGLFWILSGLVLLATIPNQDKKLQVLITLALATQLVTVTRIQCGLMEPYRQPHRLRDNEVQIDVGPVGSSLILPRSYAQYLTDAIATAKQAQFMPGTPLLDLTGQSPGILYALNAKGLGQAWISGGYPGSNNVAIFTLKSVSCDDLSTAWILTEPGGPREISATILATFGADLEKDYRVVGHFKTAPGAGGYEEIRDQQLLAPIRPRDEALEACESSRPVLHAY